MVQHLQRTVFSLNQIHFSTVSIGFFDDIVIPPESLQQPAKLYPLITLDNFTTSFEKIVQCWPNRHSLPQQWRCSVAEAKLLCRASPADCYHSETGLTLRRFCRTIVPTERNEWQRPLNRRIVIPDAGLDCCWGQNVAFTTSCHV